MRTRNEKLTKRRFLPVMLALILAAAVAVPMGSGLAFADEDEEKIGTLTVNVQNAQDEYGTFGEDLNGGTYGDVAFYRVAKGIKSQTHDTWDWTLEKGFDSADMQSLLKDAEDGKRTEDGQDAYEALAAKALKAIVSDDTGAYTPVDAASFGAKSPSLPAGIYLAVPRQAGDDGKSIVADEQGNATVTTDEYVYTFSPMMISVPSKEAKDGKIGSADDYGPWIMDVQMTTKAARKPAAGSISITKSLSTFETKKNAKATFVFRIKAEKDGVPVYDDVVSIAFTDAGSQTRKIDGIPVGATVTVTEDYDGHSYKLTSDPSQTVTVAADEIRNVKFTNDYDDTFHGGGGVENGFSKEVKEDGTPGKWNFKQIFSGEKQYND
ncbi:MAG: hypothetical protein E7236_00660 [Lachnospiraceae bacterium]|nr:hypothetical protein [Lachnospiraceae bacterium]